MGEPVAFSQAIHLALCTLYQCNLFTSVPIWAECQLQPGAPRDSHPHQLCGSWTDIPQFPLILPHRSGGNTGVVSILPPCFSLRPPSHALQEWEGRSLWAQLSSADGLVCSCCSERKLFASPRLLMIGTLKQQELGFTEDESTVT